MKKILQSEELIKMLGCYVLSIRLGFGYWLFWAWILAPDLSMLGYAVNTWVGAIVYNIFHHQGLAVITALVGMFLSNAYLEFAGLILLGHSSMDRVFGYGLKYMDSFKHTHMGILPGKEQP